MKMQTTTINQGSLAASRIKRLVAAVATLGTASFNITTTAGAQDRLIGTRVLAIGATTDRVGFGSDGFRQPGVMGLDSTRLNSITQYSVPVSLAIPMGTQWTVDLQAAFTSISLTHSPIQKSGNNDKVSTSLSGPTDIRIRATGRLFSDAVVLTAGVNLPSGKTGLSSQSLTVLRASAAPALGLSASPVGSGLSGTAGLVFAKEIGEWAVAIGGSYEVRGSYQPIAAITSGAPSLDFEPGHVVRASLGLDRVIGKNRFSVTGAMDRYSDDVLRTSGVSSSAVLSTLRLGPIYSLDAQLQLGIPSVREFVIWVSDRVRTGYTKDGEGMVGTSGNYIDLGARTSIPIGAATDVLLAADGKVHTGLVMNQGLATSGTAGIGATLALIRKAGSVSMQPYIRVQAGNLHSRTSGWGPSSSYSGASAGLVFVTRF